MCVAGSGSARNMGTGVEVAHAVASGGGGGRQAKSTAGAQRSLLYPCARRWKPCPTLPPPVPPAPSFPSWLGRRGGPLGVASFPPPPCARGGRVPPPPAHRGGHQVKGGWAWVKGLTVRAFLTWLLPTAVLPPRGRVNRRGWDRRGSTPTPSVEMKSEKIERKRVVGLGRVT